MRFLPGKGFVYRLAMDATRQGDFQKAAILFKAINRNKPFNGSAMNSPPTPPYRGSVAAALHLMNSQCGSCREKIYGVFYKLRDKKRSKESAYVSLNLIFRTPLIPVYRLAMDATRQGDDVAG